MHEDLRTTSIKYGWRNPTLDEHCLTKKMKSVTQLLMQTSDKWDWYDDEDVYAIMSTIPLVSSPL